jgi:hypothetical protein
VSQSPAADGTGEAAPAAETWRADGQAHHRTPPDWVDDLAKRFALLGTDPTAPFTAAGV